MKTNEFTPLIIPDLSNNNDDIAEHSSPIREAQSQTRKGYLLVVLAAVLQSVRATSLHAILSRTKIPARFSLLSQAIMLTFLSYIPMRANKKYPWQLRGVTAGLLVARVVISGLMVTFNILALQHIAVGLALTLFATSSAMATGLSFIFLGYRVSIYEIVALVVNMLGVYMVATPSVGPANKVSHLITHVRGLSLGGTEKSFSPAFGVFCALSHAFWISCNFTLVKYMGEKVHYSLNVWAMGIGCGLTFAMVTQNDTVSYIQRYPLPMGGLLAVSTLNFGTEALLNLALKYCRPGPALMIRSLNVLGSFMLGFIFLNESPKTIEAVGAALVLTSVTYIGLQKQGADGGCEPPCDNELE